MKVTVTNHRPSDSPQTFTGRVVGETTTHYKVVHSDNDTREEGEWFAKDSKCCSCSEN